MKYFNRIFITNRNILKYVRVLNHYLDGFKGTIFRQTQFAEFEHFIHTEDANGTPLTSEYLSEYYGELNAKYYGPEVVRDEEISYEWARIPHFITITMFINMQLASQPLRHCLNIF